MPRLGETLPALPVADARRSVDFYCDRLGFSKVYAEDGFGIVRRDRAEIHLWQAADERWRSAFNPERPIDSGAESFLAGTASCRIAVEGVDELFAEYADHVHPNGRLGSTWWGTREFSITDLDSNLITFFERIDAER